MQMQDMEWVSLNDIEDPELEGVPNFGDLESGTPLINDEAVIQEDQNDYYVMVMLNYVLSLLTVKI